MTDSATKRPISSHPAFRWAVGLWFAALLGAGLFVMPDAIHASIRQSLGVDGMLPGGVAGKAALAGAAGFFGLVLGIVLAMRVAALNSARAYDAEEDEYQEVAWQDEPGDEPASDLPRDDEPRKPFSPREYFGDVEDDFEAAPGEEFEPAEPEAEQIAEYADFEPVDEPLGELEVEAPAPTVATVDADAPEPAPDDQGEAFGDLPLSALTQRLKRALDANRAAAEAPAQVEDGDLDPVIAFLRREADRTSPASAPEGNEDAQAALRSALDRLSQVGKPK